MSKRTIIVDGVEWVCIVGRFYVKARSGNTSKYSTLAEVKNISEDDYERLKWKGSTKAGVTPLEIANWIRST